MGHQFEFSWPVLIARIDANGNAAETFIFRMTTISPETRVTASAGDCQRSSIPRPQAVAALLLPAPELPLMMMSLGVMPPHRSAELFNSSESCVWRTRLRRSGFEKLRARAPVNSSELVLPPRAPATQK